ncbi:MAG: hypothetical protein J6X80_06210 [Lachnospiraceae bacterium]|nr:hypothetical protein [Lachnospiraceae bacterium]
MNEQKSGLCTASLVLGIICLVTSFVFNLGFLPGVLGLIFGIVCLAKKKEPRGRAKGGLITSIIGLVIGFITGIIGIVIIVASGLLVGGGIAGLSALSNAAQSGDFNQVVNVIDNIQDSNTNTGNYDLDSLSGLLNGDNDLDNQFSINENGGFDINDGTDFNWEDYLNDYDWSDYSGDTDWNDFSGDYDWDNGTGAPGDPGSYFMNLSDVYFEDLENYGYKYSYGDDEYSVYTNKNGAEFEFPAYVVPVSAFGSSNYDAYYNYIEKLGVVDSEEGYYYDEKLYKWNDEWDYAYCERVTDYGDYQNYEIWLFAFSDYSDDMVILIGRPTDAHFDEDFDQFEQTLDYMTCNPTL